MNARPDASGRPPRPAGGSVRRWVRAGLALAALALSAPASAQDADSLATPSVVVADTTDADSTRSPSGALRRALLVPGWGQVYNGQPAKVPVVVGALVGAGAFAVYQHDRYLLFRHAFLYRQQEDREVATGTPNEFERFEDEWIEAGSLSATVLRDRRTSARSNRDIAILLTGLAYALQAVDAYVAAELDGFDVSDDLSLRVLPTTDGPALSLRLGL